MAKTMEPSTSLLAKLASIAVHAQEAFSPNADPLDVEAIRGLIGDPEVDAWVKDMQALCLAPVKR